MLNLIIKSDLGFFVNYDGGKNAYWSKEYPDAFLFTSKKQAKSVFKDMPVSMRLAGAEIIQDYGLDSERIVNV